MIDFKVLNRFLFLKTIALSSGCIVNESYILDKRSLQPITPPSIQIATNKTIFSSSNSTLGLFNRNDTAITPTDSSQSPAVGINFSGAGTGFTTTLAGTNSAPLLPINANGNSSLNAFSEVYTISMNSDSDLSNWICEIFSSTILGSCTGTSTLISASQVAGRNSVLLKYTSPIGEIVQSNTLPVSSFKVRQISDTRNSATISDSISQTYIFDSKLYFNATNSSGQGNRLFQIDPMTQEVRQIFSNFVINARPFTIGTISGKMMFWGSNASGGIKLFSFDGTSIVQVSNSTADQTRNDTYYGDYWPVSYGGNLYFLCRGPSFAVARVCRYNGTTLQILTNSVGTHDIDPNDQSLSLIGDKIYFSGTSLGNYYLFNYDIALDAYNRLNSVNIGTIGFNQIRGPIAGKYYTNTNTDFSLVETTDFTSFTIVANTNAAGPDNAFFLGSINRINGNSISNSIVNNQVLFNSQIANSIYKCFSYDGTDVRLLFNNLGNGISEPCTGEIFNNIAYLTATNSVGASKLFKFDGTTLTQISNTTGTETTNDSPTILGFFDNKLYFRSNNASLQTKLYMYDGTHVVQLSNTNPSGNDNPQLLEKIDNFFYFTSNNSNGVQKFFRFCSTSQISCTD